MYVHVYISDIPGSVNHGKITLTFRQHRS